MSSERVIRPRYVDRLSESEKDGFNKSVITPTQSKEIIKIRADFVYKKKRHIFEVGIPAKYYEGAKRADHYFSYCPSMINLESAYYTDIESKILEKSQEVFYRNLLSEFYQIKQKEKLTNDEYLELMVKYVQSLPYDYEKVSRKTFQVRFPIETAVEGKGICSDKSLLLAGLLTCSGYAVSILSFEKEEHMMVGLPVSQNSGSLNTGHLFIETTTPLLIGCYADEPGKENLVIKSVPNIYKIGYGKIRYTKVKEVIAISNVRKYLSKKLDKSPSFFLDVIIYNKMVQIYNDINMGQKTVDEVLNEIKYSGIYEIIKIVNREFKS